MWQRLQPREKILLATLGACVVLFLLFYFLLIPQYDAFAKNRSAMSELEAKAKTSENVLASEKAESELAAKAAEKLSEVKPLFNNQMNDGLGLAHIGLEAMKSKVQINSYVPSEIVNKGAYLELPVKFEVSGDYPNVVSFIKRMEDLPNLADLRTLKMQPGQAVGASAGSAVQNYTNVQLPTAPGTEQDGRVTATFDLVIYSSIAPEARLKLEQEAGWQVGRQNAFQTPGSTSPYTGIEAPAQEVTAPPASGEDLFSTFLKQLINQSAPNSNNTLPGSSGAVNLVPSTDSNQQQGSNPAKGN